LVGGDGHELVSGIPDGWGGKAQVCGTLEESRAVDFPSEQLAFQQRKLHAVRNGHGIKHGRSPGGEVAAANRTRAFDKRTLNVRSLVCNDEYPGFMPARMNDNPLADARPALTGMNHYAMRR
jgi:predicted amidohydrolase